MRTATASPLSATVLAFRSPGVELVERRFLACRFLAAGSGRPLAGLFERLLPDVVGVPDDPPGLAAVLGDLGHLPIGGTTFRPYPEEEGGAPA